MLAPDPVDCVKTKVPEIAVKAAPAVPLGNPVIVPADPLTLEPVVICTGVLES